MKINSQKLFNPLFSHVSWNKHERIPYTLASIALGILTLGVAHGIYGLTLGLQWLKEKKWAHHKKSHPADDIFTRTYPNKESSPTGDISTNQHTDIKSPPADTVAHKDVEKDLFTLLKELGLDISSRPLSPPPTSGCKVELPNPFSTGLGNTCWFNSTMKMFASSKEYDPLFRPRESDTDQQKIVRKTLGDMVNAIRMGPKVEFPVSEYNQSLETVLKIIADSPSISLDHGSQNDPTEFLMSLTNFLDYTEPPKFTWKNHDHFDRPIDKFSHNTSAKDGYCYFIGLQENHLSKPTEPINIENELSRNKEVLLEFTARRFTELPNQFTILFNRLDLKFTKHDNPIELTPNGEVALTRYEKSSPKKRYVYKIKSAILHFGSGTGGHYVTLERTGDTTFVYHSDKTVRTIDLLENGEEIFDKIKKNSVAYTLELDHIEPLQLPDQKR